MDVKTWKEISNNRTTAPYKSFDMHSYIELHIPPLSSRISRRFITFAYSFIFFFPTGHHCTTVQISHRGRTGWQTVWPKPTSNALIGPQYSRGSQDSSCYNTVTKESVVQRQWWFQMSCLILSSLSDLPFSSLLVCLFLPISIDWIFDVHVYPPQSQHSLSKRTA